MISAVGPNFQGRRDNIDAFIGLDDASVKRIAYLQTMSKADNKRHENISNVMVAATPLAAGVAAAAFSKGPTKIFSKEVTGLAAKCANGLKVGAIWGAGLAAIGLVCKAKDGLANNSPKFRQFEKDHPLLSTLGLLSVSFVAFDSVDRLAAKLGRVKAPKFLSEATEKFATGLNKESTFSIVKRAYKSLSDNTPSALKSAGKSLVAWAPHLLLLGALVHSISHSVAVNREYNRNYNNLKDQQLDLARARQTELTLENDFFKTNPQNVEDLSLLKNPTEI